MFRGSDGLDKDQARAGLGALLGGIYNADTTETVTQYTYAVPADNLDIATPDRGAAHARPVAEPGGLGERARRDRAGGLG